MGIPNENASFDPDILRPKGGRGTPGGGCAATPEKDTKNTRESTKRPKPKGPLGFQSNLAAKAEPTLLRVA